MAQKLNAPMPPTLDLGANYKVKINARDPNDGSLVTGVVVSNFSLLVTNLTGGNLEVGGFQLVPGPAFGGELEPGTNP